MTTLATAVQCDEMTARALTTALRQSLGTSWDLLVEAYQRRAWAALGYQSWDAYTDAELGEARLRLPREERREVVASMTEAGMSTRAIGSALGVNEATVSRDRARVASATRDEPSAFAASFDEDGEGTWDDFPDEDNEPDDLGDRIARELAASDEQYAEQAEAPEPEPEPKRVTGTDGKTYPAIRPPRTPDPEPAPEPSPAVTDYLASSQGLKDSGYVREFMGALHRAHAVLRFEPDRLADLLDEMEVQALADHSASLSRFTDTLRRGRSGLRVINGGN